MRPSSLLQRYRSGKLFGVEVNPEYEEEFNANVEYQDYGDVCEDKGIRKTEPVGNALYLPCLSVVMCEAARQGISGSYAELSQNGAIDPWPERQTTGDCVSHWARNHCDIRRAGDIIVRGEPEGWVTRTATEPIYGDRGHSGQGANCARLAGYVSQKGGMMLRQPYPDLNLDLSTYNARIGMNWGRSGVPEPVKTEGRKHQIQGVTRIKTVDQLKQAYRNGQCVGGCSSMGISDKRDENGVSKLSGSWAHAMTETGFDERPEIIEKYGEPLILVQNSWGKWNRGGRRIYKTDIDIPHGSTWIKLSDFVRRKLSPGSVFVFAGATGWEAPVLTDYGLAPFKGLGW